jgi:hypothetical protein
MGWMVEKGKKLKIFSFLFYLFERFDLFIFVGGLYALLVPNKIDALFYSLLQFITQTSHIEK